MNYRLKKPPPILAAPSGGVVVSGSVRFLTPDFKNELKDVKKFIYINGLHGVCKGRFPALVWNLQGRGLGCMKNGWSLPPFPPLVSTLKVCDNKSVRQESSA